MSNSTNVKSFTYSQDILRALVIVPMMDKYILLVLYVVGIIGSLLNMFTLLQKKFRTNSCSLYFLSASITDFFLMNGVLMMDVMKYLDPTWFNFLTSNRIGCKLGQYPIFFLPCLSSTFITLACIDRFCTSSRDSKLRKLSQLKVSRILISSMLFFWAVFSIHISIFFDALPPTPTQSNPCRASPDSFTVSLIIDGFFFSIYNGGIVPILLLVFGLLTYRNVVISRRRTAAVSNPNQSGSGGTGRSPNLNRYNLHLITMVFAQSSVTVLLNIPYMTVALYGYYRPAPSNQTLLLIYYIFVYIARWFWYSNYVKIFYINSLSNQMFREALKQQVINFGRVLRLRLLDRS